LQDKQAMAFATEFFLPIEAARPAQNVGGEAKDHS
jgi:hypothetical protein